ncbi:MAG TPA: sigma factor-like helix-turn-helix DNA-binding protein, partial [Prosthecobacter sp.]|nr:sigma factor-like helix-turn-helix DNA-binding protein [Prosthecobacter sp.]
LVLSLYYFEELNLKEIGQVLEVTESRVSQLHTPAGLVQPRAAPPRASRRPSGIIKLRRIIGCHANTGCRTGQKRMPTGAQDQRIQRGSRTRK